MLYVKFTVEDESKYQDFQKVYDHMLMTRQSYFEFEEEEDDDEDEFDWMHSSQEEINQYLEENKPEVKRYKKLFPAYADAYLKSYLGFDASRAGVFGFDLMGIFNYLEFDFEVDLDNLERFGDRKGLVEFSTGNYPFGGMERFFITLKAFGLIPVECFNGFEVYTFDWVSEYEYKTVDLPEKTKRYKEERVVDRTL